MFFSGKNAVKSKMKSVELSSNRLQRRAVNQYPNKVASQFKNNNVLILIDKSVTRFLNRLKGNNAKIFPGKFVIISPDRFAKQLQFQNVSLN